MSSWTKHSKLSTTADNPLVVGSIEDGIEVVKNDASQSRVIVLTTEQLQVTIDRLDERRQSIEFETHDVDQLVRVEKGAIRVRLAADFNEEPRVIKRGQVILIKRQTKHQLEFTGKSPTIVSSVYTGIVH